ncbi:MAG TPA: hypothetical protein VEV41_27525 [Terriglobales bacterium]|nr:hypothetical protein [Terriglobales bacterium]
MRRDRLLALSVILLTVASSFAEPGSRGDGIGQPIYTVQPIQGLSLQPADSTIITVPTWSNQFNYKLPGGKTRTFRYTMVGTSPWAGSATTTVPVEIIPIALIFPNGASLDGASRVAATLASPIFQPFASQTGFTQFGDAVSRASFYSVVQKTSPDWHVLLSHPAVLPTLNITVPPEFGFEFTGSVSGVPIGLVNMEWFGKQLRSLLLMLNADPHSLPIFLTYNAFLFAGTPDQCCVIGLHSALASPGPGNTQNINTFIWATHNDARIFSVPLEDITALSHEVAEWYSDPLMSNIVPAWVQPGSSACFSNILEVGDAIETFPNLSFRVLMNGSEYHPQDVALFSWFARQSPSIGLKGRYSYKGGKLLAPAPHC